MDYYTVLGLTQSASMAEVQAAYRRLVKQWHPDLNPTKPGSSRRFRQIQDAYNSIMSGEAKRHGPQASTSRPESHQKKRPQSANRPGSTHTSEPRQQHKRTDDYRDFANHVDHSSEAFSYTYNFYIDRYNGHPVTWPLLYWWDNTSGEQKFFTVFFGGCISVAGLAAFLIKMGWCPQ